MLVVLRRFRLLLGSFIVLAFGTASAFFIGPSGLGFAGEFDDLLGEAVQHGTDVDAARSRKDAAESSVRKAWSKFLPSVEAYGEFGHTRDNALGRFNRGRTSYDNSVYGVSATLPIYRGGANYYGLKEAKANALAENQTYRDAEQLLLLNTARAILGIIRDREIVTLQKQNQIRVAAILHTTQSRFRGGEATRTDIAIAEDQLTAAQSVYAQALDNLRSNEAEFKRIIGRKAGRLPLPKNLPSRLPRSLGQAIALAEEQNPQLLAAIFRSEAAEHSLKSSYSGFLPKVDLNMDYSEERFHGLASDDSSDLSVKLNFTIPLFPVEAISSSKISQHISKQRKFEARDARFTAKAMVTVAWSSYKTAIKRYNLAQVRIKAAQEAAKGMRRELEAGQRTVLDVLDTQERLVQAKVEASNTKYERYMSAHLLLSAIGRLDTTSTNVDGLETYVSAAKGTKAKGESTKWKTTKWKAASYKARDTEVSPRNIKPASFKTANSKINQTWKSRSIAADENFVERTALKSPLFPVLPVRKIAVSRLEKKIAAPALVKASVTDVSKTVLKVNTPVKVDGDKGIVVKETPAALPEQVKPEQPLMRKGIYSRYVPRRRDGAEIVTGSVASTEVKLAKISNSVVLPQKMMIKKEMLPLKKTTVVVEASELRAPVSVPVVDQDIVKHGVSSLGAVRPFSVHMIPLPEKKPEGVSAVASRDLRDVDVVGSIKRSSNQAKAFRAMRGKVGGEPETADGTPDVYPATWENRFAVWWNDKVDKVIGENEKPKPVLVPLDEYRARMTKD